MKRAGRVAIGATVVMLALVAPQGLGAQSGGGKLRATLTGFEEPPSISSTGNGTFELKFSEDGESFDYVLDFADLEGTVVQAHIHIAQPGVNGGIAIWLCGTTLAPGPAAPNNPPSCGEAGVSRSGHVEGTATRANVIGPAGQGIAPGEWEEVVRALRAGFAYANVHSSRNPGGEIRGQIGHDQGGGNDGHR